MDAATKRNDPTVLTAAPAVAAPQGTPVEVLRVFLKLGVSSFGGPIAHIGYFREEFVVRRRWIDEHAYADLVPLHSDYDSLSVGWG
jgi:hypothetical protein